MKQQVVRDIRDMYDQTLKFLEGEGMKERLPDPGPRWTEYQKNFRTVPEKYLSRDNLLLLLKDV